MRSIEVAASPKVRVMAFLDAFKRAPNDADIETRIGQFEGGRSAVYVTITGGGGHAFTSDEARTVASVMEDAMNAFPNDPESRTLPNIIMALRHAADAADRAHG